MTLLQGNEASHVNGGQAGGVELQGLARDEQVGGIGVVVADYLPLIRERAAQIGACGTFGEIRP